MATNKYEKRISDLEKRISDLEVAVKILSKNDANVQNEAWLKYSKSLRTFVIQFKHEDHYLFQYLRGKQNSSKFLKTLIKEDMDKKNKRNKIAPLH